MVIFILFIFGFFYGVGSYKGQSMIKEINGIIYIGGKNSLSSYYMSETQTLIKMSEMVYSWPDGIMNGSDIGQVWKSTSWPSDIVKGPSTLAFDNCLNWKQEHPNETVRRKGYDFQRLHHYTSSGDFQTMSYTCLNSFIKGIETLDGDKLWVCGTFGAFPRAFSVNKTNLEFIEFVDVNVMSCSRYVDEPMATYVDKDTKSLYVASGWGLYKPDKKHPDVPDNNSTMLYADWRLYRNLYTLPAALSTVLSSDVNFIDVVKETKDHLYFFGHEINNQYGLNNQDDRNAWQSFMVRICKNDLGFKYSPYDRVATIKSLESIYYYYIQGVKIDYRISPRFNDLKIKNLPSRLFVTPMKINFGCYISKRPRAISDNHFWGETNVVYLNKLVDVDFDPRNEIKFITKNKTERFRCQRIPHSQIPLLGLFNGPGIVGSGVEPTGALCQLQINKNIFVEEGSSKSRYSMNNNMNVTNAFEELMAVSSTSTPNFFERTLHRTNGFTLFPWFNQGVMSGKSDFYRSSFKDVFQNVGSCHSKEFYERLNIEKFRQIHNFTNTAWPNEISNRLVSLAQSMCQYYAAELVQFNASFIIPGVEFKRMFIISKNITTYAMHSLSSEESKKNLDRRFTSPLMIVGILSTRGMFYRVVLCDFDNGMVNHGYDKTSGSWYNWCIFRHTNQPYLYRQFTPMEDRERGESSLYRASSLLSEKLVVDSSDLSSYPINRDPQFHAVKGVLRKMIKLKEYNYSWAVNIMNGSDIGFTPNLQSWSPNISQTPSSLAFDNCLNWKDEHLDNAVRLVSYDHGRMFRHTASGDWETMNYTCLNNFIKGIEEYDSDHLWICGTFGTFPRAFLINKMTLKFTKFVDMNIMSCARYLDEPMVTFKDKSTDQLYVASGWGLYKPNKVNPDKPNNNSTMMYSDWRLYRNLFTLPSAMAWVLSSDVNFINVVKETNDHLYFFGHEINSQYGLNNQEDRQAWQSFLLRICKNDLGFKYIPAEIAIDLNIKTGPLYFIGTIGVKDFFFAEVHDKQDYNPSWYKDQLHLPTKHFTTPLKINFGCYMGRRPRSISDNHFWGDTNVVYLNRLADVIFDPNRRINFTTKTNTEYFGCTDIPHSQIPLVGLFNMPGLISSGVEPTGALCQMQINENIFIEHGSKKNLYHKHNLLEVDNAYEEIMTLSSTSVSNFYGRTMYRTNGYALYPYWNQGVLIGGWKDEKSYKGAFNHVGSCENEDFFKTLNLSQFIKNMNFSNTAWPNELPNRLTSLSSSICQYSAADLYSFNATFIIQGVEFKRIFLVKDNITDYVFHKIHGDDKSIDLRQTSPLMIVVIVSTRGDYYRVVLCDFDNGMANRGKDHTSASWYNWCIFRNTDQPYLYRQYTPMENRERGKALLYRGSSLLYQTKIVLTEDLVTFPINKDPQFHVVKDIIRTDSYIHVVTSKNIHRRSLKVECASYTTCIDCASDPECMWHIKEHTCGNYQAKNYSSLNHIQDVLDRGFRCGMVELETSMDTSGYFCTNGIIVSFSCKNAGFWRGKIIWKSEEIDLNQTSSNNIVLSDNNRLLTFLKYNESYKVISCYGLRDDHDKLYNSKEYEHVLTMKTLKLLNEYHLKKAKGFQLSVQMWVILFLFISNVVLLVVVFKWSIKKRRSLNLKKKKRRNDEKENILVMSPEFF